MAMIIAICTYAMRRLSICLVWLQGISERSTTEVGKYVPLLLGIPIYKLSHFCFKIA